MIGLASVIKVLTLAIGVLDGTPPTCVIGGSPTSVSIGDLCGGGGGVCTSIISGLGRTKIAV
tara:strand:- start:126 stop:311 length:186 start_codon:yes stop_codon:yes gene_type:complete